MVARKNIIQKVKIGVNTPSVSNGMQLKDGLSSFFYEEIFPEMDLYFNSIFENKGKTLRFDTITLEISINENESLNNLKELIIKELKNKIDFSLTSKIPSENSQIKTTAQSETEAFLYFLEYGSLPWWSSKEIINWAEFLENFDPDAETVNILKTLFTKPEVRRRLVYQFDDSLLYKIVFSVLNISNSKKQIELKIPDTYRMHFWEASLRFSINKNQQEIKPVFKDIPEKQTLELIKILNDSFEINRSLVQRKVKKQNLELENSIEKDSREKDSINSIKEFQIQNEDAGILIQNAGLILLHPFLKMFFEKMEFLSEKIIKPEKMDEAIHALHYLATGKEQPYEYELVFEKFLCNLPLHFPVNRHIQLSKAQKMACEILLEAVLGHWTALKSKSTEILQNEFLQREGKLIVSAEKQELFIQRKTQDILLNKLPWNLQLIKIPWHKKILFVEW